MIDFNRIESSLDSLKAAFWSAKPYEHVVIDGALTESGLRQLLDVIRPPLGGDKSSDYIFAKNKYENPRFDELGGPFAELRDDLLSDAFRSQLSVIYGKELHVDPNFVGGGLHQGGAGSYLDMHADFSRHPRERDWVRELNILLYLNDPYDETWGGHLEMRHLHAGSEGRVAPIGNRLVIMRTKDYTLHGYKRINFPPGRYRTSIAAYAYSIDSDLAAIPERTTVWHPQAGGVLKRVVAAVSPSIVGLKRKFFGSSTVKRARR